MACIAALSCSGKDSPNATGNVMPSSCISFGQTTPPAPQDVVAIQGVGSSCNTVVVELTLTDVMDVFAVSFDASFNPTVASYRGYSLAGSVLISDGAQIQAIENTATPGVVSLALTRTNPAPGIDFNGTGSVVRLMFNKTADSGSDMLTLPSGEVFDDSQPPVAIPGIDFVGGNLNID